MAKVKIEQFSYETSNFVWGEYKYRVIDLIESSKDLPEFDLPLQGVDLSSFPWGRENNVNDFIYHMNRVQNANLDYPIILDHTGYICDGWHRVVKAILEGRESIKAKRLYVMPDPIG